MLLVDCCALNWGLLIPLAQLQGSEACWELVWTYLKVAAVETRLVHE